MNPQPFTDKKALDRGFQVIESRAPLFSSHLAAIKENMQRVAISTEQLGFRATAEGMRVFARGLK